MPYIKSSLRQKLAKDNYSRGATDAAELNYLICREIDKYCENIGFKYQTINDIKGVLDSVSHEFTQRFVNPYEKLKLDESGEVFLFMSERIKEIEHEKKKS